MTSPDASEELISSIVDNLRTSGKDDWESMSVIIDTENDEEAPVAGTEGFLYSADAFLGAAGVSALKIESAVWNYMSELYAADDRWPVRLLVQFNRVSGRYQVLVEETDVNRWEMTPDTIHEVREELRPRL